MKVEVSVVPRAEVDAWVRTLLTTRFSVAVATLLAGDRWWCVSDVVVAKADGQIAGIATIAANGELDDGKPSIIALYVLHEHRGKGIGFRLLEAAVDYMLQKGWKPIHVDAFNTKVLRMIQRLPASKREKLKVVDHTMHGLDAMLEI